MSQDVKETGVVIFGIMFALGSLFSLLILLHFVFVGNIEALEDLIVFVTLSATSLAISLFFFDDIEIPSSDDSTTVAMSSTGILTASYSAGHIHQFPDGYVGLADSSAEYQMTDAGYIVARPPEKKIKRHKKQDLLDLNK